MNYQIKVGLPQTLAFNVLLSWLLSWLLASTQLFAAPEASNSGFMRHPPKALKEKFPMCDAFLEVEWVNKQKKIGYAHYEAMLLNDKGLLDREKKKIWALVYLDDLWPSYTLDIYQYQRQGRMKALVDIAKNGEPTRVPARFAIKYKGNLNVFYDAISPVLSDHRQNVCIAYPDEQRAWVIESKNVGQSYDEQQKSVLFEKLSAQENQKYQKLIEKLWVLDINHDGIDDYIFDGIEHFFGPIIYSHVGQLFELDRPVNGSNYVLTFPHSKATCLVKIEGVFPLTTDGKNYYINNQCNLTALTTSSEKE